jgi:hypothetical protein
VRADRFWVKPQIIAASPTNNIGAPDFFSVSQPLLLRHQAGFAVADGSNATLKAGISTVNDTFTRKTLHHAIPFPNSDYHRNRRQLRFSQTILHYGIFVYWLTFHNEFCPTA